MFDSLGNGREGVFLTTGKHLRAQVPATAYLGAAVISNEDEPRLIAGSNVLITKTISASAQFDGRYAHIGLIGQAGSVGGAPIRLGVVYSRARYWGPLVAVSLPLR
jgi:hypothetical protein